MSGLIVVGMNTGDPCWSRGRVTQGTFTGSAHACQLAGCNGWRVGVRWPGGKITFPCSKGMSAESGTWEIL